MTSANQISDTAAAELKEWGGRVLLLIFQTIPAPIILSVIAWKSLGGPLSSLSCSFETGSLFGLWPANFYYIRQLRDSQITSDDRCWFFAVTSTASIIYLCWLCWLIFSCVLVLKDVRHVRETTKYILPKIGAAILVGIFALVVAAGLILVERFKPSDAPDGLSTLLPIGWSAFKVVFFVMPYSYFVIGLTTNLLLLLLRYLIYWAREH